MTEAVTVFQWSRLSDHIGRKLVLLIGMLGLILSMLFFGLSRTFLTLVIRFVLLYMILLRTLFSLTLTFAGHSRCFCGLLNGNVGKIWMHSLKPGLS